MTPAQQALYWADSYQRPSAHPRRLRRLRQHPSYVPPLVRADAA
jgi:hypothetical protein